MKIQTLPILPGSAAGAAALNMYMYMYVYLQMYFFTFFTKFPKLEPIC